MKREVEHQERLIKLGEVKEVQELYQKIQELDEKYGVNSNDEGNSFGILNMEKALVSYGYESNIYFFMNGYSGKDDALPKYQNAVIPLGQLLTKDWRGTKKPLEMEEQDKLELFEMRKKAVEAVKAVYPKKPIFKKSETAQGKADNIQQLEEQGFAAKNAEFKETFYVNGFRFVVQYEWLQGNRNPYFSTTYKGWQNQDEMPHDSPFYVFYKKWDPFHTEVMTRDEYEEMRADLAELKEKKENCKVE